MNTFGFLAAAVALTAAVLAGTGWWRLAFNVFAIRSHRMTVNRLGLLVNTPADVERVNTILRTFGGGFNMMITARSESVWRSYCESLQPLYRPFAEEGVAMGYALRHLLRYSPAAFENRLVKQRPQFRYLHYVGLGFWSGMRNHSAQKLSRVVDGLDPMHGYLCYDGYGFKRAFFDYPKTKDALQRLDALDGYARNAAYQGVGRAFFFLFMARPDVLVEHIDRLGQYAEDAAAGVGLAAVFVNPDRLEVTQEFAVKLPQKWQDQFHLGMCFGLKARAINDTDQFERDMARMDEGVQDAVYASIRECDRMELLVRAEGDSETQPFSETSAVGGSGSQPAYRRWRVLVTEWMAGHIEYPMAGVKPSDHSAIPEPLRLRRIACAESQTLGSSRGLPTSSGSADGGPAAQSAQREG